MCVKYKSLKQAVVFSLSVLGHQVWLFLIMVVNLIVVYLQVWQKCLV